MVCKINFFLKKIRKKSSLKVIINYFTYIDFYIEFFTKERTVNFCKYHWRRSSNSIV